MTIPEKTEGESVLDYAVRLSEWHSGIHTTEIRKAKGQFFTPKKVAAYMADLFDLEKRNLRVLDPGAGTGVLSAALCTRVLNETDGMILEIDAFENDVDVIPVLRKVLETCKAELKKKGHEFGFTIYESDFVSHNLKYLNGHDLFYDGNLSAEYDFIISNPPYYKLKKNLLTASLERILSDHPNIYTVFMALSLCRLKKDGELVFITPRSFCSGAYYRKFRKWFVDNACLRNIHLFESRKEIFDSDEVLQENVIIKAKKSKPFKETKISVSISLDKEFQDFARFETDYDDIVHRKNGDMFIRIPNSFRDVEMLHVVDLWPNTLHDLGLEISTGPVVPFRAEKSLSSELQKEPKMVPLLWMHNLKGMRVVWPLKKNSKASAILLSRETNPLLIKVRNLVLIKRFSSKEQKRRLYAAVLDKDEFQFDFVGLENHLNYVHQLSGDMPHDLAFGLAALFNSEIIDNYFRCLNGNTQVNASDMRSLPLPSKEKIITIGKLVHTAHLQENHIDLDNTVNDVLAIKRSILVASS
ncbi:MAG: Eco57I restriction-modification methylase domain-containing protein [Candidatus Paceibacterota bacterium]